MCCLISTILSIQCWSKQSERSDSTSSRRLRCMCDTHLSYLTLNLLHTGYTYTLLYDMLLLLTARLRLLDLCLPLRHLLYITHSSIHCFHLQYMFAFCAFPSPTSCSRSSLVQRSHILTASHFDPSVLHPYHKCTVLRSLSVRPQIPLHAPLL